MIYFLKGSKEWRAARKGEFKRKNGGIHPPMTLVAVCGRMFETHLLMLLAEERAVYRLFEKRKGYLHGGEAWKRGEKEPRAVANLCQPERLGNEISVIYDLLSIVTQLQSPCTLSLTTAGDMQPGIVDTFGESVDTSIVVHPSCQGRRTLQLTRMFGVVMLDDRKFRFFIATPEQARLINSADKTYDVGLLANPDEIAAQLLTLPHIMSLVQFSDLSRLKDGKTEQMSGPFKLELTTMIAGWCYTAYEAFASRSLLTSPQEVDEWIWLASYEILRSADMQVMMDGSKELWKALAVFNSQHRCGVRLLAEKLDVNGRQRRMLLVLDHRGNPVSDLKFEIERDFEMNMSLL